MNGRNNYILTKDSLENANSNKKLSREKRMDYEILGSLYQKYLDDNPELEKMLKKQKIDVNQFLQFLTSILKNSNIEEN